MKAEVRTFSVEPDAALHGLEGLKHMGSAIVPGIYDRALAVERLTVATERAQGLCREMARRHGLLLGPSGGANLAAALDLAERASEEGKSAVIVTVFPDSGERYLSDRFWRA